MKGEVGKYNGRVGQRDLEGPGGVELPARPVGGGGAVDAFSSCCPLPHSQKPFVTLEFSVTQAWGLVKWLHSQRAVISGSLVIQTMEFRKWNVLSFLSSPTDPCLSFGSTYLDIDSDLLFLCVLGLLLLFLWYLVGLPCLPTFCKIKGIQKVRK